jgi:hypothetical protein
MRKGAAHTRVWRGERLNLVLMMHEIKLHIISTQTLNAHEICMNKNNHNIISIAIQGYVRYTMEESLLQIYKMMNFHEF